MGRRWGTVRARVTALATVVVLAVLVLAGVALVAQQRRVLTKALDEGLEERARELLADGGSAATPIAGLGDDDALAQVIVAGEVVATSANAAELAPVATAPRDGETVWRVVGSLPHEDGRFRVVSAASDDGRVVVHVAGALDDIDDSVGALRGSLLAGLPLVGAVVAALVWWLVGRTLQPVESIRTEVATIGATNRSRRVPVPPGDDEVARLARTMNEMLGRLEDAAERQQRFLADASHELRSPLTRIRTQLEVDLAHPAEADLPATHRSVLDETVGLQRLAEDLLVVARSDGGAPPPRVDEEVDLDDIVLRAVRRLRAAGHVRVDASEVSAARVVGDRDQIARLVGNLVDNAARHARSTVTFSLVEEGAAVVLRVGDDGPGIPEEDRGRVFERFARLDAARTPGRGGTGLGLAIARDIAEAHGGTLTLDGAGPGATFVLRLPRQP